MDQQHQESTGGSTIIIIITRNLAPSQASDGTIDNFFVSYDGARRGTCRDFALEGEMDRYVEGLRRGFEICGFKVEITREEMAL